MTVQVGAVLPMLTEQSFSVKNLKEVAQVAPLERGQFQQALENVRSVQDQGLFGGRGAFEELQQIGQKLTANHSFSPRELLLYQIKASDYHLRVELVAKTAESMLGTVRKFQNSQG